MGGICGNHTALVYRHIESVSSRVVVLGRIVEGLDNLRGRYVVGLRGNCVCQIIACCGYIVKADGLDGYRMRIAGGGAGCIVDNHLDAGDIAFQGECKTCTGRNCNILLLVEHDVVGAVGWESVSGSISGSGCAKAEQVSLSRNGFGTRLEV